MKVRFENNQGLSDEQLSEIENLYGVLLPTEVREFLKTNGGATPRISGRLPCFDIRHPNGWNQGCFVEKVISFERLMKSLEYRSYLEEFVEHFSLSTAYVEAAYLLSIAELPSGEVLTAIAGQHTGKVYTADSGDFGILYHSNSLEEFWNSCYEC